jgi:ubiquinol-cytochrome c reductase iron-sulfur subunit
MHTTLAVLTCAPNGLVGISSPRAVWSTSPLRQVCVLLLHFLTPQFRVCAQVWFPVPTTGAFQQRTMHISAPRRDAPEVPDLSAYQASSASSNRALSYFVIGSMGVLSASVAKSSVTEFLGTMSASADVLALAKVEVELASIPEGKNAIIKWRGKPVFIRHRTQQEVDEARQVDWKSLRDPQSDDARVKKPEWLVMLGVCTHLGCVPIGESGDFGGWSVFGAENVKYGRSCSDS